MARQQDPEHELDPLLRRAFRPSAAGPTDSCVDAEMLAAWADGTLRHDEVAAVERHAADCTRCRAMLAAFVRSDVPAPARDAVADAAPVALWRRWRLQWLVPIAATATALVVFVAAPESPAPASKEAPAVTEVAREEKGLEADATPSASAEPRQDGVTAPSAPAVAARPRDNELMPAAPPLARGATSKAEMPSGFAPVPEASADQRVMARAAPPAAPDAAPATAPPALPPSPPQEDAPAPAREPVGAASSAAPASPPSLSEALANGQRSRLAAGVRTVTVAGTETAAGWRVNGARLERSADGATWRPVTVPAGVDVAQLTAGAAAGRQATWLVGRGGLVLVSADGGAFRRTTSPGPIDLVSAQARDARVATVATADGRRFETTDGGDTWIVP